MDDFDDRIANENSHWITVVTILKNESPISRGKIHLLEIVFKDECLLRMLSTRVNFAIGLLIDSSKWIRLLLDLRILLRLKGAVCYNHQPKILTQS